MDLAQKSSYFFQKTTLLDFELCYTIIRPPAGILKRESPARNRVLAWEERTAGRIRPAFAWKDEGVAGRKCRQVLHTT